MARWIDPFEPAQIRRLVGEFGSPLLIIDCARVRNQYRKLRRALPGVDLHYALKPQPDVTVVKVLAAEGAWFDLATNGEVEPPPSTRRHRHRDGVAHDGVREPVRRA